MKRPLFVAYLILCNLLLAGCNTAALKAAPNDAARLGSEFHQRIDDGQWDTIYSDSDQKYQDAVAPEKSEAILQAIHRKLGTLTKLTMENWQIQATTNGTFLRAAFSASYSTGATSTDTFVWRKDGDAYKLVNWNVNSDALILK